MFTIATPCPRCGAYYLGQQTMIAVITDGNSYFGTRKVCRCGWKSRTFGPKPPDGLRYEPRGEATFEQNWRALAAEFAESLERCCQVVSDHMAGNTEALHAMYQITDILSPYSELNAFAGIVPDELLQRFPEATLDLRPPVTVQHSCPEDDGS